jgi:hypothetical protein
MLVVWQMITTSNWHDIMNSAIVACESRGVSIYFIACYILVDMVLMNLLIAIVIGKYYGVALMN